jgi:hypothetical protein
LILVAPALPTPAGPSDGLYAAQLLTDTTAPTISAPSSLSMNATGPAGAIVSYTVAFSDAQSGVKVGVCAPASGSPFPIGTTSVHCIALDYAGNTSTASFSIHVASATEQLTTLHGQVSGIGPGTSLADKITLAQNYLQAGNKTNACGALNAFINQVKSLSKSISPTLAAQLNAEAKQAEAVIGC